MVCRTVKSNIMAMASDVTWRSQEVQSVSFNPLNLCSDLLQTYIGSTSTMFGVTATTSDLSELSNSSRSGECCQNVDSVSGCGAV
jgi:hypothetical protein